jgi:hypothetical protein
VRGNPQALFGKRPTEKDPAKGTSPAVDFTRRAGRGNPPGAIPAGRPGPTQPVPSARRRCCPSWRASTPTCCAGCARNTNGCGDDARHKTRGTGRYGNGRGSSPTGPGSPGSPPSGDQNDKSRVTRDCYARFCESRGLRCPGYSTNASAQVNSHRRVPFTVRHDRVSCWSASPTSPSPTPSPRCGYCR